MDLNETQIRENLQLLLKSLDPFQRSNSKQSNERVTLNLLYLAPLDERFSFHYLEKETGPSFSVPLHYGWMVNILNLKSYFEATLANKGIFSIANYPLEEWVYSDATVTDKQKREILNALKKIEGQRGLMNALLTLRNIAFFPGKNQKFLGRKSASYLKFVLHQIKTSVGKDPKIAPFLAWCGKRTRKLINWGFKEKELRDPPMAALPIHETEAANYIKYFLELSTEDSGKSWRSNVEMLIFLSIALACGRQQTNFFTVSQVLKITKDHLSEIHPKITSDQTDVLKELMSSNQLKKSKSTKQNNPHKSLLLKLPGKFLKHDALWKNTEFSGTPSPDPLVKSIIIKNREIPISDALAKAIEAIGHFTLTTKDIENHLSAAHKEVGFIRSTGGLCTRCFFFRPHIWKDIDERKNYRKRSSKENKTTTT